MGMRDEEEVSGESSGVNHLQRPLQEQLQVKGKKTLWSICFQDIGLPRLLLMIAAGAVLLVLSLPIGNSGDSGGKKEGSGFGMNTSVDYGEVETASEIEIYTEKKERQLEEILSKVRGIGKVEVMITLDFEEEETEFHNNKQTRKVEGVLVVAQGAGEAKTDTEIIQAVQALFPLESHKIRVMKME